MRQSVLRGCLVTSGLVGACAVLSGCGWPLASELPVELSLLKEQAGSYAQDPNGPLEGVAAGTPIDDLEQLSGCWAAYSQGCAEAGCLNVYQFLHFDPDGGRMTRVTIDEFEGTNEKITRRLVTTETGNYSITGAGRIHFEITSIRMNGLVDGFPVGFNVAETSTPRPAYDIDVTLSGDSLKISFIPDPNDGGLTAADQLELVHKRLDCPD